MHVCCIADLHGRLPDDVPECDLLLVAGDISAHSREENERFLRRDFPNWLVRQPAGAIVGIAGNHDFVARNWPSVFRSFPWIYLDNETTTVAGLKIWGSAWTPWFGSWAFMADDEELAELWRQIPNDVDMLLTHGPMYGLLDKTGYGAMAGSLSLRRRVLELERLQLHACGHIHGAHGCDVLASGAIVVNASLVNERYEMTNAPILVQLGPFADRG
jgi:Icc-related predicted phosphoesterase